MVLVVAVIGQVVRALAVATVDGTVAAVIGLIRPAVTTKHKEQTTEDDDIPASGRKRIEWRQLLPRRPLSIRGGKVAMPPAAAVPEQQQRVPILVP